jgi:hypothetical protein
MFSEESGDVDFFIKKDIVWPALNAFKNVLTSKREELMSAKFLTAMARMLGVVALITACLSAQEPQQAKVDHLIVLYPGPPVTPIRVPAPESNQFGFNADWGFCTQVGPDVEHSDATHRIPFQCSYAQETMDLMRGAGMGWQRYNIYSTVVAPKEDMRAWRPADDAMTKAKISGINTWAYFSGIPPWVIQGNVHTVDENGNEKDTQNWGKPNYCLFWTDDPRWKGMDIEALKKKYSGYFLYDVPDCAQPHPVDTVKYKALAKETIRRYPQIKYWSFLNENHYPWGYAPGFGLSLLDMHRSLAQQILIPAYEAVQEVAREDNRELLIVGPDEDWRESLEAFFQSEQEVQQKTGHLLTDIITVHLYDDPRWYPKNALDALDYLFKPLIQRYGQGRPTWIGETGSRMLDQDVFDKLISEHMPDYKGTPQQLQADGLRKMYEELWARRDWVRKVFLYRANDGYRWWMRRPDGSFMEMQEFSDGQGNAILNGDSTPRLAYYALKELIFRFLIWY